MEIRPGRHPPFEVRPLHLGRERASEDVTWRAKRLLMATLGGNLQPPLFVAQAPNHRPVCQPGN